MPIPAITARHAPPADADSPLLQGPENRVRSLALLLRLSLGIILLPALLLALVATLARHRGHATGLWYLSSADQDEIDSLSPRARRAVARLLAVIGWSMAGTHNRGMRPHARTRALPAPANRPSCGPRAPPNPA